ncbi:MAG: hypothetical protein IIB67_02745, partial [Proteobacteria bacterium]|nr:hypothetical protein [Pseudomonadota bacterium]
GAQLLGPERVIFGSDELSLQSPAVAERVAKPCITINAEDAESLGVAENNEVELAVTGSFLRLPAKLSDELPRGVAAVPVGLPGVGYLDLSAPVGIARAAE